MKNIEVNDILKADQDFLEELVDIYNNHESLCKDFEECLDKRKEWKKKYSDLAFASAGVYKAYQDEIDRLKNKIESLSKWQDMYIELKRKYDKTFEIINDYT